MQMNEQGAGGKWQRMIDRRANWMIDGFSSSSASSSYSSFSGAPSRTSCEKEGNSGAIAGKKRTGIMWRAAMPQIINYGDGGKKSLIV